MSSQEKTQIVLFLQRQGFHLDPKSTSFNPGDLASGNAEWLSLSTSLSASSAILDWDWDLILCFLLLAP